MDDLISRQAAIDAICSVCGNDCDKSKFLYDAPQDEQIIICPEHYVLTQLPSAQPRKGKWIEDIKRWLDPDIDNEIALERIREIVYRMDGEI